MTTSYEHAREAAAQAPDIEPPTGSNLQMRALQANAARAQSRAIVQLMRDGPAQRPAGTDTAAVHDAAARGISGSGGRLPHLDAIQQSFGHHDVSAVQAHVGGRAAEASAAMGAEAYATGNDVAFSRSPGLHTAAHEAAHVVQQRGGVSLKGGVGQIGDPYERHADAVADRVVQGESAVDLLDQMAGGGSGGADSASVQRQTAKPAADGKKKASGAAIGRLKRADEAIKYAKQIFAFGAGNQRSAIRATRGNSYARMSVTRTEKYWKMAPLTKVLANLFPDAAKAAKAEIAQGGNCGEHARVAFEYLRTQAVGETINRCGKDGLDHAFVIMGDVASESDADLVVCDPWPTQAKACTWADHFAYTADKSKLEIHAQVTGDGTNVKAVIAAGLKLTPEGQTALNARLSSDQETEDFIDSKKKWMWEHADAHAPGRDHDYVP